MNKNVIYIVDQLIKVVVDISDCLQISNQLVSFLKVCAILTVKKKKNFISYWFRAL